MTTHDFPDRVQFSVGSTFCPHRNVASGDTVAYDLGDVTDSQISSQASNVALRAGIKDKGYYATMGFGADLMAQAKDAVGAMVDYVTHTCSLDL